VNCRIFRGIGEGALGEFGAGFGNGDGVGEWRKVGGEM